MPIQYSRFKVKEHTYLQRILRDHISDAEARLITNTKMVSNIRKIIVSNRILVKYSKLLAERIAIIYTVGKRL